MIAAGSGTIRFSVDVPASEWRPAAEGTARELSVAGYQPDASGLPVRVLFVAVPPEGAVRVSGVGLDETRIEVPDGFGAGTEPATAAPSARLLDVSWLRNQRVARIEIAPARFDPAGGQVALARRIEVAVNVSGATPSGAPAETNDAFEDLYRRVLVNYDQGRAWRRTHEAEAGFGAAAVPETTSVFAGRNWVKIAVTQRGFKKVEYQQIKTMAPFSAGPVPIDSVRLFAWPGMPTLDEANYCDDCDYKEVAIGFVDNGDGMFGSSDNDAVYFYGLGPSDWSDVYNPARSDTVYFNNPYETRSYYYLTASTDADPIPGPPRRIGLESGAVTGGAASTPATFEERLHFETDVVYVPTVQPPAGMQWQKWFWIILNPNESFQATFDAPGIEPGAQARFRMLLWGLSFGGSCFPSPDPANHVVDLTVADTLMRFGWNRQVSPFKEPPFFIDTLVTGVQASGNAVRLTVPFLCPNRSDEVGVAWFSVSYPRKFEPVGGKLAFDAPPAPGGAVYDIGPFSDSARPRVFDVTDPMTPVEISGFEYTAVSTAYRLRFQRAAADTRRYRVLPDTAIARVSSANVFPALSTSLVDLRSPALGADYMLIYYDEFKAAADSLAAWRREHNGFEVQEVPISALYDQFSGGRTDPAAIRNFLRVTWTTWEKTPAYVTFLGDASYDFKNILGLAAPGRPGALLPSYPNSVDLGTAFTTDDWILNVDDASVVLPDFYGGRLPADDAGSAMDMVLGKVLHYERGVPFEAYRDRVMLVADDNMQGGHADGLGWAHVSQTAVLDSTGTPAEMDRVYVYLHTYPTGPNSTKPGAKKDIISNLNGEGVTIFNYIGHGSPVKMSDESVFQDADVGALVNGDRLPLVVAASCDIGRYDDPGLASLGERLVLRKGGGAVAVISATDLALSSSNALLNLHLYQELFNRDASGRFHEPISEALLKGKISTSTPGGVNNQKYQLLGDAATRLNLPELWVNVTLWDSAGTAPLTEIEQGRTVTFRGSVREGEGGAEAPFDGVASLLIEDSAPIDLTSECPGIPYCNTRYFYRAATMYRGDVSVHGGTFEGRFVVPVEARTGAYARAGAYVAGTSDGLRTDGAGSVRMQLSPGPGSTGDVSGPQIRLSFEGGATAVRPDATLRIDLQDPSGILTTGYSPQNGIVVTVDGNSTGRVDVTPSFRYAADSYQAGTARYQLGGLEAGPHRIEVSAADNLASGLSAAAHRSSAAIDFEVAEVPSLYISQAFLFPNPILSGNGGTFVVDAPGDSVNVLLHIYTVSGRLIRTLRQFGGYGQVQIPWDGRDAEGQRPAAGIYVFKVHANVRDPDGSSSPRQKAVAEGKFAVLGR